MSSRSEPSPGPAARPWPVQVADDSPVPAGPDYAGAVRGLVIALGFAGLGALAVSLAPLLEPAVAADRSQGGGSFLASGVVAVLLGAVVVAAVLLTRAGRLGGTAGLLAGVGAVALGSAVLDLQLFARALDANRLELFRPVTAAELAPGPGAVAVLAGHLLLVAAGVLALGSARRTGVLDEADELFAGTAVSRIGASVSWLGAGGALVAAGSLFAAPLTSTDPVVLVPDVLQGPPLLLVGAALMAAALLVVLALALTSASTSTAAGALAGSGAAALVVLAPRWVAAAQLDDIGVSGAAVLGTIGAGTLLAAGVLAAVRLRAGHERSGGSRPVDHELPGPQALHLATAVAGGVAGVLAVVAALLPAVSTQAGVPVPGVDASRVLLLAGVLLAAGSAGMLAGVAEPLRPLVGVLWVAVPLGAGGVLQSVLVATSVPGVGYGPGAAFAVLAVAVAAVCGACAGLAGAAERDDVDVTELEPAGARQQQLAAVAAVLVVLGLGLPLYAAPGFDGPGLLTGGGGWDSWAQAIAGAAVVIALAVAVRARPRRASALLVGVALVLGVHLLGWPLTAGRLDDVTPSSGAAATVLALAAAGVLAAWVLPRRTAPQRHGSARGGR